MEIETIKENWSKSIYFSMIADSRFNKDIKKEIERLHKGVLKVLNDETKFKVYSHKCEMITFENEKTKQFRVYYKVEINKINTKKNDLYGLVNSIKAVYYGGKWGD